MKNHKLWSKSLENDIDTWWQSMYQRKWQQRTVAANTNLQHMLEPFEDYPLHPAHRRIYVQQLSKSFRWLWKCITNSCFQQLSLLNICRVFWLIPHSMYNFNWIRSQWIGCDNFWVFDNTKTGEKSFDEWAGYFRFIGLFIFVHNRIINI